MTSLSILKLSFVFLAVAILIGCEIEQTDEYLPVDLVEFTDDVATKASDHPQFSKFKEAKGILIGKATFQLDSVMESYPAIYVYNVSIEPEKAIKGRFRADTIKAKYEIRSKVDPNLDVVPRCLLLFGRNQSLNSYFELTDDKLIAIAQIAAISDHYEKEGRLEKAKANPKKHPLYKSLEEASLVVKLSFDQNPSATVSYDHSTSMEVTTYIVKENLKGSSKLHEPIKIAASKDLSEAIARLDSAETFVAILEKKRDMYYFKKIALDDEESSLVVNAFLNLEASTENRRIERE